MTLTTTDLFEGIIGQENAKRRLEFYLTGHKHTSIVPHMMFIAPKGCGKTTMAKATAKNLMDSVEDKPKKFYEINCSTIKNVAHFFNQLIIPHVNMKECTILFDEASELPKDVTMALLTILNPNKENRTTFSYEDYVVDFDFRQQSFMFATTEAHTIFHALMDRCERIDLEEYTYNELGRITAMGLEGMTFDAGLLDEIATVLRGNARAAQKIAINITNYTAPKGLTHFGFADWESLKHSLGILPLGLSRIELQILRILTEKKECSLTNLAAKTGLTAQCIRQDFEMYLQKCNLMDITTAGRSITVDGLNYIEDVRKAEATAS